MFRAGLTHRHKSVNVFPKVNFDLFQKQFFMQKKIFKMISALIVEIEKTDYRVCLLANNGEISSYLDFSKFDEDNSEMTRLAKKATCVRAFLLRKSVEGPLLSLDIIKKSNEVTKSYLSKSSNQDFVYNNFLANISPVKDEINWWKTLNEFINAVQYAVKMRNGLKEIARRNII